MNNSHTVRPIDFKIILTISFSWLDRMQEIKFRAERLVFKKNITPTKKKE
jgi:hypothetical protein